MDDCVVICNVNSHLVSKILPEICLFQLLCLWIILKGTVLQENVTKTVSAYLHAEVFALKHFSITEKIIYLIEYLSLRQFCTPDLFHHPKIK